MQDQRAHIDLSKLTRIGQGRTAEVFALDDARVIKVAHADTGELLEREATAMRAAHAANMPVPAAHALLDLGGRRALIMSRARGVDMLTQFARRPWTIIRAGAKLGRLHAKLHETVAPAERSRHAAPRDHAVIAAPRASVRHCCAATRIERHAPS